MLAACGYKGGSHLVSETEEGLNAMCVYVEGGEAGGMGIREKEGTMKMNVAMVDIVR